MNKKIINLGLCGLLMFGATSCIDTLDTHPTTIFDEATVWGSKATADAYINATYNSLVGYFTGSGNSLWWECRTPNSVHLNTDGISNESIDRTNNTGNISRFGSLRRCNMIIERAEASTSLTEAEKKEVKAHGYFLRGLMFFDQARKTGRFVPMTKVLSQSDEEDAKQPMTKDLTESYNYALADLEAAVDGLPISSDAGIPNKYAAEVVLSRAYLTAYAYTNDASYIDKAIAMAKDVTENCPLSPTYGGMFNETDEYNSEILWGYYRLASNSQIVSFTELINIYPNVKPSDEEASNCPVRLKNKNGLTFEAWGEHYPTQDLVDQYLVNDEKTGEALPWYETSQYKENVDVEDPNSITTPGQVDATMRDDAPRRIPTGNDFNQLNPAYPMTLRYHKLKAGAKRNLSDLMYSNRDARFATSVVYDGTTWLGENIETNLGGNLSMGVRDTEDGGVMITATGYYWRKCTVENPEPRAFYSNPQKFHYCIARTGEAYMNLAEAYLLKKNIPEAVKALNATRTTHGKLAPSTATTEKQAWEDYIRERTCEMTNENGDLYFSYLRWGKYGGYANHGNKPGDIIKDLDRPSYKIEISRDRSKLVVNQVTLNNNAMRLFTTKRYLLPIAQSFLDTREAYGIDHVQNEGW